MAGRGRGRGQVSAPDNLVSEPGHEDESALSESNSNELNILRDRMDHQESQLKALNDSVEGLSRLMMGLSSQLSTALDQMGRLSGEKNKAPQESVLGSPPIQPFNNPTPIFNPSYNGAPTGGMSTLSNRSTQSSNQGGNPKCRPDFPIFTGENVHGWLYRVRQLMEFYAIPVEQHVSHAALFLDETPLQWYRWLEKGKGRPISWWEFERALLARFGPSEFLDYKGSLSKLQQTGSLEEYQAQFEKLSNFVDGLPEDYLVSCFVSGLREEIRYNVMLEEPATLERANRAARIHENKLALEKKSQSLKPLFSQDVALSTQSKPTSNNLPLTAQIKRLTPQEAKERREKGLCYHCDEKYVMGHRCKSQKLFLIEGIPIEEVEKDWGFNNIELEGELT